MTQKIAIVVPCHIPPSDAWIAALDAEARANEAQVVIVDDSDGKLGSLPDGWLVFGYKEQEQFLGELYPEFARMFHKCSACRVFGHLWAYNQGYDTIIGLDSDCIVARNFVRDHIQFLDKEYGCDWFNPIGYPHYSRGYPYSKRAWPIKANMGLWSNVLDINGRDRKENEPTEIKIQGSTVPGAYFPFSGMNWAIKREAIFGFLFLPNFKQGSDQFNRIDDVWGGYIFEKLMQLKHYSSMVGYPFVFHDTMVDPKEDENDELAMYKWEDTFVDMVNACAHEMRNQPHDTTSMHDLMLGFIDCWWHRVHDQHTFNNLTPALLWWEKAIEKYA